MPVTFSSALGWLLPVCLIAARVFGCSDTSSEADPSATVPVASATSPVEAASPTPAPSPTEAPPQPSVTPEPAAVVLAPSPTSPPRPTSTTAPPPPPTATPFLPPPPAPIPDGPLIETLKVVQRSFEPHEIHGNAGQVVILTVQGDSEEHTFTIKAIGLSVDVKIPAGRSVTTSFIVPQAGISTFYCSVHGTTNTGMHGLLIFH